VKCFARSDLTDKIIIISPTIELLDRERKKENCDQNSVLKTERKNKLEQERKRVLGEKIELFSLRNLNS